MAQLASIVTSLDRLLQPESYNEAALNGLQIDSGLSDLRKVGFAVDSGLSVIDEAIASQCGLLVVHHGLYWGKQYPITGVHGEKVRALIKGRCSLYASHLPLDGNPEVGNAFELGRFLGIDELKPFCLIHGGYVGAKGVKPCGVESILERSASLIGGIKPLTLLFGPSKIKSIGIVTGSGSSAITLAHEEGLDLLVSGEPKQEAYHLAKELKMNVVFLGHYATETFGVRALAYRVKSGFDVETIFIDQPTGI